MDGSVLVVGAGGIGCELLKVMVLSGFSDIHVVDLDTIDVSNLNRQFLFRKQHVGKPKSLVAAQSALEFLDERSRVSIRHYQGNIMTKAFGSAFFKQFSIVLNALDNAEARRHVNRVCVALGIPLVESGTGGYLGQVKPIVRDHMECFECDPSLSANKQTSYPVCTIRNTPDKPVHCITWAKQVFDALFGPKEIDSQNYMADLKLNDQQYKTHEEQAIEFYAKVFDRDIQEAAKVSERWVARDPPTPLPISQYWKSGQKCSAGDQSVGNVQDMAALLIDSFVKVLETRSSDIGAITFDKDDKLAMDFVSAASNLRMKNFGIPNMSTFDVKGIAGNIIHAIATTNAIAAGLMVLQAQHILKKDYDSCRSTWIRTTGPSVLQPEKMRSPNPKCTICSLAHILVTVNTEAYTLEQFFSDVLMNELKFTDEADVDVENRNNYIGPYAELSEERKSLKLADPSIRMDDGATLTVFDADCALKCRILICHSDDEENVKIEGGPPSHYEEDIQENEPEAEEETSSPNVGSKRERDSEVVDLTETSAAKKTRVEEEIDLIE